MDKNLKVDGDKSKKNLVQFLFEREVIRFGLFTTRVGRKTPYYFNLGALSAGDELCALGSWYAGHIAEHIPGCSVVFGPAYKGIPIAVAAVSALALNHGQLVRFASNRKEQKSHGDAGAFLGKPITPDDSVVIVEDVITAGSTLKEVVPMIRATGASISGVVVLVDRQERGSDSRSSLVELSETLGLAIKPLLSISEIVQIMETDSELQKVLTPEIRGSIIEYQRQYGGGV